MARIVVGIRDWGGEIGTVQLPVAEPTEIAGEGSIANYWNTIASAIQGVTLGVIARSHFVIEEEDDPSNPTSQFAQREFGLRLLLRGNTSGVVRTITLPTVDADALELVPGTDQVVLADGGAMAALVTALETNLRYQFGATVEQATVTEAYIVGRNS